MPPPLGYVPVAGQDRTVPVRSEILPNSHQQMGELHWLLRLPPLPVLTRYHGVRVVAVTFPAAADDVTEQQERPHGSTPAHHVRVTLTVRVQYAVRDRAAEGRTDAGGPSSETDLQRRGRTGRRESRPQRAGPCPVNQQPPLSSHRSESRRQQAAVYWKSPAPPPPPIIIWKRDRRKIRNKRIDLVNIAVCIRIGHRTIFLGNIWEFPSMSIVGADDSDV